MKTIQKKGERLLIKKYKRIREKNIPAAIALIVSGEGIHNIRKMLTGQEWKNNW